VTDLEEFRETHRIWSTNNARAMSAMNRDLMEARARIKELESKSSGCWCPNCGEEH
jgi:hypothetical protein